MRTITKKETKHGPSHATAILPAGVEVEVEPASNLPDDSPIKYWVNRIVTEGRVGHKNLVKLRAFIGNIGVGLHLDDVDSGYTTSRLEYLRGELQAERISYEELGELQSLAAYIDPDDVELAEPAGLPDPGEYHGDALKQCEYGNGADCNNLPLGVRRSPCKPCQARAEQDA